VPPPRMTSLRLVLLKRAPVSLVLVMSPGFRVGRDATTAVGQDTG
jgi:hypothetical protein